MFKFKKVYILAVTIILIFTAGCTLFLPKKPAVSVHLTLGNPSNANTVEPNNYLMVKKEYALSYNRDKGIPNWVSWELNKSWLGTAPRSNNFRPDDTLVEGWYRVIPSDYTRSGYDKGHMTPSADRSNNAEDNAATFLMTNIIPQAPDNNQGYWARLEDYGRTLAQSGKELYIISGSYGQKETIALKKVAVPARIFKIIVVAEPGIGVNSINESTRVIAVDTPNVDGNREADWREFLTSVDAIEKKTGYDFLSDIKPSIQQVIEAQIDQSRKINKVRKK
ncbi:MAG: DNA/RNA non-specific endonuclease [Cyanomargarita calcarea GSE-NOS-MK-12-04C]|jgi:endonuclease G|uniref:DNA/RNA non-specific endonuclease n=1 Tax=Cyanomargarita calcarea GSE-NOS-MK-12-04C TaxID=2839659 RepID=A0A951QP52_9CYAN|nr:DNA/RNA non-specific endonuclease [Cyanomargarita calcarea GSE-NOS-MK-12-04C]